MTLKYHTNNEGMWTRCVAQTVDSCPFATAKDHLDRTGIAHDDGGVIAGTRHGTAMETTVTPVVAGVYAVFTPNDDARTYTAKGDLIPARDRADYLETVLRPAVANEQTAKDGTADPMRDLLQGLSARLPSDEEVDEWFRREGLDDDEPTTDREQYALPGLTFSDSDTNVVIRRAAPAVAGPPTMPKQTVGGIAPGPTGSAPHISPTSAPVVNQSAKAMAQAKRRKRARRRKMMVTNTRRAVRGFKKYDRQLNKVARVGGSGKASSKSSDWSEGLFSWFLDLFDLD